MRFKKKIGFKENITVEWPNNTIHKYTATMDSGNGGMLPTIGVKEIEINEGKIKVLPYDAALPFETKLEGEMQVGVGNVIHKRPIIRIPFLIIGKRYIKDIYVAITDNRNKSTQALINRNTLKELKYIVDSSKEFTL